MSGLARSLLAMAAVTLAGTPARPDEPRARPSPANPRAAAEFENRVRPLLVDRCVKCHGPRKQESNLRLDSRAAMMQGGDSGPAIVPGKPGESLLVKAIRHEGDIQMPPDSRLKAEQVATLSRWIAEGAPWPVEAAGAAIRQGTITAEDRAFWSLQPVRPRPAPEVRDRAWVRTVVDRWILAELEARGLRPGRSRGPSDPDPSRHVRPDRVAADARRRSTPSSPTPRPTPSPGSSTGSWRRRPTASIGAGTGSTSSGTPIPPERPPTIPSARRTGIAITSSRPSTGTCPTTGSSASRSPATSWPRGRTGPAYARMVTATGFLGDLPAVRVRLRELPSPDDPGHDRHDRPGVPRPDARLRPMPRPQVRPRLRPRLLRALRHLRQHAISLRRLGAEAEHAVHGVAPAPRRDRDAAGLARPDRRPTAEGGKPDPSRPVDRDPRRHRRRLRAPEAVGRREPRLPRHSLALRGAARRDRRGPESVHELDLPGRMRRSPLPPRRRRPPRLAADLAGADRQHDPRPPRQPRLPHRVRGHGEAPGSYRFTIGHGPGGSPAVAVFIGASGILATDGDSPRSIRPLRPGTWYNLRLTLDLERRTYSGTIGAPGDVTTFSDRSFASGWDGTIDTVLIDGKGPVAGVRPALDVDNIAVREEPIAARSMHRSRTPKPGRSCARSSRP